MELDELKAKLVISNDEDSKQIREKYLSHFVNTESSWYRENIANPIKCSDGMCYIGYIWGALKKASKISEKDLIEKVNSKSMLMVMWDINSKDYIRIPDYWKFPKQSVVRLESKLLISNLKLFPEDIYIFDETFLWSLILTHEVTDVTYSERLCFFCEKPI